MTIVIAEDMTPGHTYQGTADGPEYLDGVTFTVLTTVAFDPEAPFSTPPKPNSETWLLQVAYDAWAYPMPEVSTFSPYDVVVEVTE